MAQLSVFATAQVRTHEGCSLTHAEAVKSHGKQSKFGKFGHERDVARSENLVHVCHAVSWT